MVWKAAVFSSLNREPGPGDPIIEGDNAVRCKPYDLRGMIAPTTNENHLKPASPKSVFWDFGGGEICQSKLSFLADDLFMEAVRRTRPLIIFLHR
jgi:hypothetical protein